MATNATIRKLLLTSGSILALTYQAVADVPFVERSNGDLEIKIVKLTKAHMRTLAKDIPAPQWKCVKAIILDSKGYEMDDAIMRIPAERHGIEFEPHGDGRVRFVCGRFTEDWYDYDGNLTSSTEYSEN